MSSYRSTFTAAAALAAALLSPPSARAADKPDPTKAEVPLPAGPGWDASLIYESDVGIWTCGALQIYDKYGAPEVFGLDDKGRCTICVSYSGKWTPFQTVEDGEWLGALAHLDLDPRVDGKEIYTGGKKGNLYQIVAHEDGGFDASIIARFPAQEIHTIVGGDLLPERPGRELLVFSRDGVVWDVRPRADGRGFDAPVIEHLGGRVRQGIALPARPGERPWIAAALRSSEVMLLRMTPDGLEQRVVVDEPMGFGRLAIRPGAAPGGPVVLYATRDDGVVLRLAGTPGGPFEREVIYAGPQGMRGVAAGRFDADPAVETVAVFGYSKKVQLLSRRPGAPWRAETIFTERDKGHWLTTIEVDGRNATDELIASGYGARMVLLSREPGYGLEGVPTDAPENPDPHDRAAPAEAPAAEAPPGEAPVDAPAEAGGGAARATAPASGSGEVRPIRVAVRADAPVVESLHPLSYRGGFVTKTALYETLVRRDGEGRLAPGLASSWTVDDDGRGVVLHLREGATWHDGSPVVADDVVTHLRRFAGLPEHAWLRGVAAIERVRAVGPREVRIEVAEPVALLADLCAINPCAVRGPASLDRHGEFVRPVGSGPYRFLDSSDDERIELAPAGSTGAPIELRVVADGEDAVVRLRAGELDVVADGWSRLVPRAALPALRDDPDLAVREAPGSSVVYLSFRFDGGPTASRAARAAVRGAIDRAALIAAVEAGAADPCTAWAAPTVREWPAGRAPVATGEDATTRDPTFGDREMPPLRLVAAAADPLAEAVVAQLRARGIPAVVTGDEGEAAVAAVREGRYDLRLERTWGIPYDPLLSLVARFVPPAGANAADERYFGVDPELSRLVEAASRDPNPEQAAAHYAAIQRRMDEVVAIVPLYVPRRVIVARAGVEGPRLDHDLYRIDLASIAIGSARS